MKRNKTEQAIDSVFIGFFLGIGQNNDIEPF
jgi:hypothetical protein